MFTIPSGRILSDLQRERSCKQIITHGVQRVLKSHDISIDGTAPTFKKMLHVASPGSQKQDELHAVVWTCEPCIHCVSAGLWFD